MASSSRNERAPDICFVCCIESGLLEPMTLYLVESLRRFGGRLRSSAVVAVTPRFGPPLRRSTRELLRELDVEHLRVPLHSRFSWYHYLNKPVALAHAEKLANTELMAFLDSDVLVLGEPTELALAGNVDFTASVSDVALGGTTGAADPTEPAWRAICDLAGVTLSELPWVTTHLDRRRIRLYFNSGVFAYRRTTELGRELRDMLTTVLRRRIRLPGSASRVVEQVLLTPLVIRHGLRWTGLPFTHNHTMASYMPEYYRAETFRTARIVHYHDSMEPHFWPTFAQRLGAEHPEVAEWLRPHGPIATYASPSARALAELLRVERGVRRRAYEVGERRRRMPDVHRAP